MRKREKRKREKKNLLLKFHNFWFTILLFHISQKFFKNVPCAWSFISSFIWFIIDFSFATSCTLVSGWLTTTNVSFITCCSMNHSCMEFFNLRAFLEKNCDCLNSLFSVRAMIWLTFWLLYLVLLQAWSDYWAGFIVFKLIK